MFHSVDETKYFILISSKTTVEPKAFVDYICNVFCAPGKIEER